MPFDYRKPGVYVEESLLVNSADTAAATSVALFVGVTPSGPIDRPVRCNSWSDYVMVFGGFGTITDPSSATAQITSYLPYAVYSFFQNGGRPCYVQRVISTDVEGTIASVDVTDGALSPETAFTVSARSVGTVGNDLSVKIEATGDVFTLSVFKGDAEVERFQHLTMDGTVGGTTEIGVRKVDLAVNDPYSGSSWVVISDVNTAVDPAEDTWDLADGTDPGIPDSGAFSTKAIDAIRAIDGPVIVNAVGYRNVDASADPAVDEYVAPQVIQSSSVPERGDVFVINDSAPARVYGQSSSDYKSAITSSSALNQYSGDSYVASFTPWLIIPDPKLTGSTITVPPGGAVAGVMSRIDSTVGVFRAPAGIVASITNAVGVDTKFSDSELGDLNSSNINVIRPVQGAGIAIMGARTRKVYGADRYISARRTLIYIKESLRRSTQFALFENNDNRLWTQLIMTAERLLRPLWEAGGLRGTSSAEAYYVKCDASINTPSVIASGEVRMEIGVALEYPAEFIVIRVSQYESGGFAAEVQPQG